MLNLLGCPARLLRACLISQLICLLLLASVALVDLISDDRRLASLRIHRCLLCPRDSPPVLYECLRFDRLRRASAARETLERAESASSASEGAHPSPEEVMAPEEPSAAEAASEASKASTEAPSEVILPSLLLLPTTSSPEGVSEEVIFVVPEAGERVSAAEEVSEDVLGMPESEALAAREPPWELRAASGIAAR